MGRVHCFKFFVMIFSFCIFALQAPAQAHAPQDLPVAGVTASPQEIFDFKNELISLGYSESEIGEALGFVDNSNYGLGRFQPLGPGPNGCSTPIKIGRSHEIFRVACNAHDYCYSSQYNRGRSRLVCDDEFLRDMRWICDFRGRQELCYREAKLYYKAVRYFGRGYYKGHGDAS